MTIGYKCDKCGVFGEERLDPANLTYGFYGPRQPVGWSSGYVTAGTANRHSSFHLCPACLPIPLDPPKPEPEPKKRGWRK